MIDEASIRNMSPVQLIDALMQHVDDLQSESEAIPEDSIRWERMLEIDAAIAVAIEKLPDAELRGDCSRIGFCRIPYSSCLTGHFLVTNAGYFESGQTWRQMMRILKAQCTKTTPKTRGRKPDPAKDDIERLHEKGTVGIADIVEILDLKKRNGKSPEKRVGNVINAMKQRQGRRNRGV